jgi:hypothetical protein
MSACDRTESDWKQAKDSNSVPAYTDFLSKHSQSVHTDEAKEFLAWNALSANSTVSELNQFLKQFPNGPHSAEATSKLNALRIMTFMPPASDGNADEFLSALRAVSDEYQDYTKATAQSSIEVRKLSVSVINDLKSFMVPEISNQNGTSGFRFPSSDSSTLGEKEREQVTNAILESCKKYLEEKCSIEEGSPYRIVIMIYGGDSVYSDKNGRLWGNMSLRLLFLDTSAKHILWFTRKAWGLGNTAAAAADFAGGSINKQLDVLFGH